MELHLRMGPTAAFLMVVRLSPMSLDGEGASLTAWPAKDGEERAIVEEAIMKENFQWRRDFVLLGMI
ncbi:hypothetical protein F8388_010487 [Cannabis sativa]|uniref:Uncharacterized protein n=1 Tax=Cannabis sativa TaxID=3483 RepID=A0A7J6GT05_CANSA|nr:hypothetical protein F8388_010487 [Cannabis sativa]